MQKKLIMACMAIAALAAFVVAPAASASPALTESGVKVAAGTSITGKNTGNVLFTGGFAVECSSADLKGTVSTNTGSWIGITVPLFSSSFTGSGFGGDCTSALGDVQMTLNGSLCLETSGADTVPVNGCGGPITFTLKVTSAGISCAYSTASVTGSFKTNAAATVNVFSQGATRESGQSFLCPSEGRMTMDFDLTTTDGTQLTIS